MTYNVFGGTLNLTQSICQQALGLRSGTGQNVMMPRFGIGLASR